jgi:D-glycero-D-manno-heptose 1,7-bisphosphate phosphatase
VARFVLLDRDGTLTRDAEYTYRLEDYALLPGVVEGLRRLATAGFRFAVVTNQSGIGRGLFSEADYRAFAQHLTEDLASHGIRIEKSFHCPHRPEAGCTCRKPGPGLLLQARDTLGADLARSWMIGNDRRDVEAGLAAGCRALWLRDDPPTPDELPGGVEVARDLPEAADRILGEPGRGSRPPG